MRTFHHLIFMTALTANVYDLLKFGDQEFGGIQSLGEIEGGFLDAFRVLLVILSHHI